MEQISLRSPDLADRVKRYEGDVPLFEALGVEDKAEKALARKVWLRSGGYLIFDATEALTVVDVNSGKFVGKRDLQDTVYRVNIEAAEEIAKQLRLRDVGGIIVIDFIDMDDASRREDLVETLRAALKDDRNRTNVVGLTGLGLVEMTRKKSRASLSRSVQRPCPHCHGTGKVYTPDQIARKALREISLRRRSGDEQRYLLEAGEEVSEAFARLGGALGVRCQVKAERSDYVFLPEL
jgi:ribonuclease G